MEFYRDFFVKGFTFEGCTSRGDYWKTQAVTCLISCFLMAMTGVNGHFGTLYILFALAIVVPSISITVRRLHDMGESGWSFFKYLIPIAGPFIVIYYLLQPSKLHGNPYAEVTSFKSQPRNSYHSYSQSSSQNHAKIQGSSSSKQSSSRNQGMAIEDAHVINQQIVKAMGDQGEVSNKFNRASLLLTSGRYNESIQAYMALAAQHPDRKADCAGQIGAAMYFLGDYKNAVKYYKVAKKYGADTEMMDYNIQEAKDAYYQTAG